MGKVDLNKVIGDVRKMYAKDKKIQSITALGDELKTEIKPEDCILLPANHVLNAITGLPGIPYNKIVQVAGMPDTGKSTIAGEVMSAAQKAGVYIILFDTEQKFDAARFKNEFGGNPSDVLLILSNEIRQGGSLIQKYVNGIKTQDKDAKILVVWDSVGGAQSRAYAEMDMGDEKSYQPGADAKENAQVMKMIVGLINKYPDSIATYLVNQTYAKIGFMQSGDATSGGRKIEFHSSLIVMLRRIKTLTKQVKGQKVKDGINSRATVQKNHLTQGKTSIYQIDFQVTAKGTQLLDAMVEECEDEDE